MSAKCISSYVATGLATVALVLFVSNAWIVNGSQALQKQMGDRQAKINTAMQVAQLNNDLVRALGSAVATNKDEQIKNLLAAEGITVQTEKPATPAKPAK